MKIGSILVCAVMSLALALATAAQGAVIYAATAAGAAGQLVTLDSATGAVVQLIGPTNDAAGANYGITGMAFHPTTGVLYGSSANSDPLTAAKLVTIDPATGQVTLIGLFNAGNPGTRAATMTDLAFDTAGNLYGVGSVGGPQLFSINIATGQATQVGATSMTSTTGGGLAFGPDSTLYGTPTASTFGTYNTTTGTFSNIANPTKPAGGGYGALDFDENGILYGLNVGSGTPPPSHLVTINPATGAVTDLGASLGQLDSIAIRVPEPASAAMAVMALGFATITRRSRKHS
jgi:hypothetical protein